MGQVIDNIIAYRVLSQLARPFTESDAYKLGIIDDKGNVLIKSRDLKTQEQRDAYSYLTRLVFNLKRLLAKLPGGDNYTKNMVAALLLIKEARDQRRSRLDEVRVKQILDLVYSGAMFVEEQLIVEDFLLVEEVGAAAANITGTGVSTDIPVIRKNKRFLKIGSSDAVDPKMFRRKKLTGMNEQMQIIEQHISKFPDCAIIL